MTQTLTAPPTSPVIERWQKLPAGRPLREDARHVDVETFGDRMPTPPATPAGYEPCSHEVPEVLINGAKRTHRFWFLPIKVETAPVTREPSLADKVLSTIEAQTAESDQEAWANAINELHRAGTDEKKLESLIGAIQLDYKLSGPALRLLCQLPGRLAAAAEAEASLPALQKRATAAAEKFGRLQEALGEKIRKLQAEVSAARAEASAAHQAAEAARNDLQELQVLKSDYPFLFDGRAPQAITPTGRRRLLDDRNRIKEELDRTAGPAREPLHARLKTIDRLLWIAGVDATK